MNATTTYARHEWTTPNGEIFSYALWDAGLHKDERPEAVIVCVHGLSGAALDFEPLGARMASHRVVTVAVELRGQGSDPHVGRRGDLESVDHWFRDLNGFLNLVRLRWPDSQIYYYGESMGAALLTRFLARAAKHEQPAGLILASPVIALANPPPWWQEKLLRLLMLVRPGLRLNVRKFTAPRRNDPPKLVTRDEAHRKWFETVPHKLDIFTLRFFKNLFELISGCLEAAPRIHIPVLVLYAGHDIFIPPARVEQFFALLGSREKELRFFPDSYHLLLHDLDRSQVLERIETWLLQRMATTSRRQTADARFEI